MVHGLYEEPEKDIIVGTFDNTGDIELALRQKKKKSNTPKGQTKRNCQGQKIRAFYRF